MYRVSLIVYLDIAAWIRYAVIHGGSGGLAVKHLECQLGENPTIFKINHAGASGKARLTYYRHSEQWQNPLKMDSPRISSFTLLHPHHTVIGETDASAGATASGGKRTPLILELRPLTIPRSPSACIGSIAMLTRSPAPPPSGSDPSSILELRPPTLTLRASR